jgi:hypothetical protein
MDKGVESHSQKRESTLALKTIADDLLKSVPQFNCNQAFLHMLSDMMEEDQQRFGGISGTLSYHLRKSVYESTTYLLMLASVKPALQNGLKTLCEHQLSSVGIVVPFWLAVKQELEISILSSR